MSLAIQVKYNLLTTSIALTFCLGKNTRSSNCKTKLFIGNAVQNMHKRTTLSVGGRLDHSTWIARKILT